MTPEQFCYWLNGFSEMGGKTPTDAQWKMIQDHLSTVFTQAPATKNPSLVPAPNIAPVPPNDSMQEIMRRAIEKQRSGQRPFYQDLQENPPKVTFVC